MRIVYAAMSVLLLGSSACPSVFAQKLVPGQTARVVVAKPDFASAGPALTGTISFGSSFFRYPSEDFARQHVKDLTAIYSKQKVFRIQRSEIKQALHPLGYRDDAAYTPLPEVPWYWAEVTVETQLLSSDELKSAQCRLSGQDIVADMKAESRQEELRRLADPRLGDGDRPSTVPYVLAKAKAEKMAQEKVIVLDLALTHAGNPVSKFYLPKNAPQELREKYRLNCRP